MKTVIAAQNEDSSDEDARMHYQRFEDLARQLLTVSKKDLNKRLAEYERKKKKKKARKK